MGLILTTPKSEVMMLGSKKMGRPTDNPKDISLKVRLDKTTAEKLDECIGELGVSKAEVVRRGVHKVHDDLEKKMRENCSKTGKLLKERRLKYYTIRQPFFASKIGEKRKDGSNHGKHSGNAL